MLKKRLLAALTAFAMLSATGCDAAKEKKAEEERYQPATVQYGDENCIEIEKMLLEHLTNDGALDESKLADVTELRFAGLGAVSVVCGETGGTDMSEGFYEPVVDTYFEDRLFVVDDYYDGVILSMYLYGEVRNISDLPCVDDLSFIEYMPRLECLEVPVNFIDDISPLSNCTELKMLNLCCSDKLEDISPLKSCTQLQELRIASSKVSDISALAELKELRALNLSYTEVDDLTALHELELLDTLAVMGCKKSVLKDVAGIKPLKYLDISEADFKDISVFNGLEKLETIIAYDTSISELSSEKPDLPALKNLVITNHNWSGKLKDISQISELKSLETVFLIGNEIEDISALEGLKSLKVLSLDANEAITDISALSSLTSLEKLRLGCTMVKDVTPLMGLENIKEIFLRLCEELAESDVQALREALPDCEILF